jgi:RNA polymerase sigma-70 factor (ECF subfamily)
MDGQGLTFEDIYRTYYTRILRYLTRLAGETEYEDLAQDTFTKVSQRLDGFRGESQLLTWLYTIATNTALDRLRSPSFKEAVRNNRVSDETAQEVESAVEIRTLRELTVEQQAIRQEMNACIRHVIDRLPESYRTVIVLSNLEGMKDAEIARILGLSRSAAKIRIHRARARLKKELSAQCVFYRDEDNELACDRKGAASSAFTRETTGEDGL